MGYSLQDIFNKLWSDSNNMFLRYTDDQKFVLELIEYLSPNFTIDFFSKHKKGYESKNIKIHQINSLAEIHKIKRNSLKIIDEIEDFIDDYSDISLLDLPNGTIILNLKKDHKLNISYTSNFLNILTCEGDIENSFWTIHRSKMTTLAKKKVIRSKDFFKIINEESVFLEKRFDFFIYDLLLEPAPSSWDGFLSLFDIGKNQKNQLKNKIIESGHNLNYINFILLLRKQKGFNIDKFININIKNNDYTGLAYIVGNHVKPLIQHTIEKISYKKFYNLSKKELEKFSVESEIAFWEMIVLATINIMELEAYFFKDHDIKLLEKYKKKSLWQPKNLFDFIISLEKINQEKELILRNNADSHIHQKQSKLDHKDIVVPLDLKSIQSIGKKFDNCLKDIFFLNKFTTDKSLLFIYKEICVQINEKGAILEARKESNRPIDTSELQEIKDLIEELL